VQHDAVWCQIISKEDLIQNTTYYKIEEYLVEIENECTCYIMF